MFHIGHISPVKTCFISASPIYRETILKSRKLATNQRRRKQENELYKENLRLFKRLDYIYKRNVRQPKLRKNHEFSMERLRSSQSPNRTIMTPKSRNIFTPPTQRIPVVQKIPISQKILDLKQKIASFKNKHGVWAQLDRANFNEKPIGTTFKLKTGNLERKLDSQIIKEYSRKCVKSESPDTETRITLFSWQMLTHSTSNSPNPVTSLKASFNPYKAEIKKKSRSNFYRK